MRAGRLLGRLAELVYVSTVLVEELLEARPRWQTRRQVEDENEVLRARVHVLEQEVKRLEDQVSDCSCAASGWTEPQEPFGPPKGFFE